MSNITPGFRLGMQDAGIIRLEGFPELAAEEIGQAPRGIMETRGCRTCMEYCYQ